MSAYLRNKNDGRVYVYTELLARHPDLEPYDPEPAPAPVAEPAPVVEAPKKTRKSRDTELVSDDPVLEV